MQTHLRTGRHPLQRLAALPAVARLPRINNRRLQAEQSRNIRNPPTLPKQNTRLQARIDIARKRSTRNQISGHKKAPCPKTKRNHDAKPRPFPAAPVLKKPPNTAAPLPSAQPVETFPKSDNAGADVSDNAQTTITDWRIIGVSGATADGRKISAEHLNQMAESYNRSIYGARINLEHIRFFLPDYAGYGDVLELKTAPWPADNDKTCLLARLSVLPALQELWDKGKKVYTSMEIDPEFADTGKAYLVGLAVTDDPASLGTTANYTAGRALADARKIRLSTYCESQAMTDKTQTEEKDQPVTINEEHAEGIFAKLFGKDKTQPAPAPAAGQTQETDPQPQQDYTAQIDALRGDNQQAAELFAKIIEAQNEQSQTLAALLSRLEALEAQPANPPRAEQTGEAGSVGW